MSQESDQVIQSASCKSRILYSILLLLVGVFVGVAIQDFRQYREQRKLSLWAKPSQGIAERREDVGDLSQIVSLDLDTRVGSASRIVAEISGAIVEICPGLPSRVIYKGIDLPVSQTLKEFADAIGAKVTIEEVTRIQFCPAN